ncbi:MAG: hypothetical protein ACTSUE_11840 [Promethearchaeota archaeon]
MSFGRTVSRCHKTTKHLRQFGGDAFSRAWSVITRGFVTRLFDVKLVCPRPSTKICPGICRRAANARLNDCGWIC